jgi:hypothetical protein
MGANDVLAADLALAAAPLAMTSANLTGATKASAVLAHAAASLTNAKAMAAAAAGQ